MISDKRDCLACGIRLRKNEWGDLCHACLENIKSQESSRTGVTFGDVILLLALAGTIWIVFGPR